jgi:hypothetical protein
MEGQCVFKATYLGFFIVYVLTDWRTQQFELACLVRKLEKSVHHVAIQFTSWVKLGEWSVQLQTQEASSKPSLIFSMIYSMFGQHKLF